MRSEAHAIAAIVRAAVNAGATTDGQRRRRVTVRDFGISSTRIVGRSTACSRRRCGARVREGPEWWRHADSARARSLCRRSGHDVRREEPFPRTLGQRGEGVLAELGRDQHQLWSELVVGAMRVGGRHSVDNGRRVGFVRHDAHDSSPTFVLRGAVPSQTRDRPLRGRVRAMRPSVEPPRPDDRRFSPLS